MGWLTWVLRTLGLTADVLTIESTVEEKVTEPDVSTKLEDIERYIAYSIKPNVEDIKEYLEYHIERSPNSEDFPELRERLKANDFPPSEERMEETIRKWFPELRFPRMSPLFPSEMGSDSSLFEPFKQKRVEPIGDAHGRLEIGGIDGQSSLSSSQELVDKVALIDLNVNDLLIKIGDLTSGKFSLVTEAQADELTDADKKKIGSDEEKTSDTAAILDELKLLKESFAAQIASGRAALSEARDQVIFAREAVTTLQTKVATLSVVVNNLKLPKSEEPKINEYVEYQLDSTYARI